MWPACMLNSWAVLVSVVTDYRLYNRGLIIGKDKGFLL
jgi:hypothetical protein